MRRVNHLVCILCLLLVASTPTQARSSTDTSIYLPFVANRYTNPTVWDVAGLVAAMQAANADCPSPSTIVLPPGVLTFTTDLSGYGDALPRVNCNLTILGNSTLLKANIADNNYLRFFDISYAGSLTLRNVTLSGGVGGAIFNWGYLDVQDVVFTDNHSNFGGALSNYGSARLVDVRFIHNQAFIRGGAVEQNGINAVLNGSQLQFIGNIGGALYAASGQVNINSSCLAGNTPNSNNDPNYGLGGQVVINESASQVDLSGNWWGQPDGPSGAAPGSGESVGAGVVYSGFLTSVPAGCPAGPEVTVLQVSSPQMVRSSWGNFIFPSLPITLTAKAFGIGAFSSAVHWSVISGGGAFADPNANPAVYTPGADLEQIVLRAGSVSNPEIYADLTVSTATFSLEATRKWAVVLTEGTVPFYVCVNIKNIGCADRESLQYQIIQGGGSLTPASGLDFYYNAPAAPGSAVIRVLLKANPAVYIDLPVTIITSGPHTCPNLRITPTGPVEFWIGMNPPAGAPVMSEGVIDEAESFIGQTQTIRVSASVKAPAVSPITSLTFTLSTDSGLSGPYQGTLVSGDGFNGVWEGQWVTNDTHCQEYVFIFDATNAVQTTQSGVAFR